MASTILTVPCPRQGCNFVHEIEVEIEPADSAYGADADGNRGIFIPAYCPTPDAPESCPKCDARYDDDELAQLTEQLETAAGEWEPPEPDYDYDPYGE